MKLIAHRGLMFGSDKTNENAPYQIQSALDKGFDAEIDLRIVNDKFFLGHDDPTYEIDPEFLHKKGLWIHAKNWEALEWLSDTQLNYFWHQEDSYTLTSHGIVWAYPNQPLMAKSVCVMPENQGISLEYAFNLPIYGICSDYVGAIDYFRKR
jgi:hypothetical protein